MHSEHEGSYLPRTPAEPKNLIPGLQTSLPSPRRQQHHQSMSPYRLSHTLHVADWQQSGVVLASRSERPCPFSVLNVSSCRVRASTYLW